MGMGMHVTAQRLRSGSAGASAGLIVVKAWRGSAVGFHNFNLQTFNLRVSNPNKLIVDVFWHDVGFQCARVSAQKNTMKFRKSTVCWTAGLRWHERSETHREVACMLYGIRIHVCMCICIFTCVYIYIYIYIHTCVYIYIYICIYIYIYNCLCVCVWLDQTRLPRAAQALAQTGPPHPIEGFPFMYIHPVSITRFPLRRFSPGAGLLRNRFLLR